MPITAEPVIVGMPYSEFAKKFGEDKAKAALQRIYGTTDPAKAAEMQQQRTQQILNQQPQQKPTQPTSGPASPSALVQTQPGQLAPGYLITTGQPVTQPTQLKTPNVVEPLTYKPQVDVKSVPVEKPTSPPQSGSIVYKTVEHEPLQKTQIGEVIYDVTPKKIVETTVVGGKVVDIKEEKVPEPKQVPIYTIGGASIIIPSEYKELFGGKEFIEGYRVEYKPMSEIERTSNITKLGTATVSQKFDVEAIKKELGGKVALQTQNLTTIRKPIEVEVPVGAKVKDITYEPKTGEISYIVSREAMQGLSQPIQQSHQLVSTPYSTLENPFIKTALEKGLTKEQQFRQKVEQAKQEYLQMEQQTPYSKLGEAKAELEKEEPGLKRGVRLALVEQVGVPHMILHGITEPIRQAQIRLKYGEAGKVAIQEVQAKEKEAIEQQKEQFQAEYAYYQANPKKVWEDIAKMSVGEKIETAFKLGTVLFSAYSLAKGPAPGIKETYRVKVNPSEHKVIAETSRGESAAVSKGKITVTKVVGENEKIVNEYEYRVVSEGVKKGKDVLGTHKIELINTKTGEVEYYYAQGKASEISSAIKEIMQQQAEGKEITVYQGKQLFVTKQTMYKPQAELVMQPATLEKPYPEIGIRYTIEKTKSKALGSYEFLRSLEQPGIEHPFKPYEVLGQEVGRVGAISRQKVGRTTIEFAQKGKVKAALIRGKPIEEPRGFYPLPKEKPIVDENVAAGMRLLFGEQKPKQVPVGEEQKFMRFSYGESVQPKETSTGEVLLTKQKFLQLSFGKVEQPKQVPIKEAPVGEVAVMQQSLIKSIAESKAPAPTTTKTNVPIVPVQTSPLEKEKIGVNIESANQAFFSKIGTSYVKETLLNEEEQKARVVTVGPKVTEEQVQTYLTKQIEAEKVSEATKSKQDILTSMKIKEGIEERTKQVLGMRAEQSINLEEKMVQKLVERQIQKQMLKQKVIQPTVTTRVFPTAIPTKVVPYIPKLKSLFGEGKGRKQRTRQAIQSWLKKRPITEPKDVFKALKKVKFI